jgi:hypothetical protein
MKVVGRYESWSLHEELAQNVSTTRTMPESKSIECKYTLLLGVFHSRLVQLVIPCPTLRC